MIQIILFILFVILTTFWLLLLQPSFVENFGSNPLINGGR